MKAKNNRPFAYFMSSPAMIAIICLCIFPFCFILRYCVTDYYFLAAKKIKFIGIENFKEILADEYFIQALVNTLRFTFFAVITEVSLGLLMAVFLKSIKTCNRLLRILILLPNLLPPVTVTLMWQIMYSNNGGLFNRILNSFGFNSINWLQDIHTAFYAILAIDIWQYAPFAFLLIYVALQSVPESQYEAARLDGAGVIKQFIYITLPNIKGTVMAVVLLRIMDSFRLFDKVNILTKGGPANTTATITQYIYNYGVKQLKVGYGCAASVIMTVIILIISSGYIRQNIKKVA